MGKKFNGYDIMDLDRVAYRSNAVKREKFVVRTWCDFDDIVHFPQRATLGISGGL